MTHIGPIRVKPKTFISSIGKEVEFTLELLIFSFRHRLELLVTIFVAIGRKSA